MTSVVANHGTGCILHFGLHLEKRIISLRHRKCDLALQRDDVEPERNVSISPMNSVTESRLPKYLDLVLVDTVVELEFAHLDLVLGVLGRRMRLALASGSLPG